jgi:hypothetical protein
LGAVASQRCLILTILIKNLFLSEPISDPSRLPGRPQRQALGPARPSDQNQEPQGDTETTRCPRHQLLPLEALPRRTAAPTAPGQAPASAPEIPPVLPALGHAILPLAAPQGHPGRGPPILPRPPTRIVVPVEPPNDPARPKPSLEACPSNIRPRDEYYLDRLLGRPDRILRRIVRFAEPLRMWIASVPC